MKQILFAILTVISTAGLANSASAQAGDYLLEDYIAYIGPNDLFNSAGVRLSQPWAIVRQDRANVHRFGIADRLDQSDSFFASEVNRDIMEWMLRAGDISPRAARDVIAGGVLIHVEIYGRGSVGRALNVEVV